MAWTDSVGRECQRLWPAEGLYREIEGGYLNLHTGNGNFVAPGKYATLSVWDTLWDRYMVLADFA